MPERIRIKRDIHDALENDEGLDLLPGPAGKPPVPSQPAAAPPEAAQREMIEHLNPSRMIPDRFQPRPVLPVEIQSRFFAGQIDCYQAAGEWLKLADKDRGHQERVSDLITMAGTIQEHGQIKAITGTWVPASGGGYLFQIETGERRFWGVCLKHVREGKKQEPSLRVEAVRAPSLERQIIENRHAEPPSAVAQAREIAALVLGHLGQTPAPALTDPYDYFRKAILVPDRQRLPRGLWVKLEPLMQLRPRRMQQMLSLLRLPTPLLEKADRYDLSSRVLEAVLAAPAKEWAHLIEQAAAQSLTGEEVAQVAAGQPPAKGRHASPGKADPARSALRGLRGFANAFQHVNARSRGRMLDELADEIFVTGEAEGVVELLQELTTLVRARIKRSR